MTIDATVDVLATTITRLEAILGDISGLKRVVTGNVQTLPTAALPACIVIWGPSSLVSELSTEDVKVRTREFSLLLAAKPWVLGTELEAGEVARPFVARFAAAFDANPSLHTFDADGNPNNDPLDYVDGVTLTGDTGVTNIVVGNVSFAGTRFFLEVTTLEAQEEVW